MSDVQQTINPTTEASAPTTNGVSQQPETTAAETAKADAPAAEPLKHDVNGETDQPTDAAARVDEKAAEAAPATEKTPIEPITEGQLSYKGPGILKSVIPMKKDFWLSDSPVTPQHMDQYMRGEKPEISNPVVAWASQTGKGLLFFNKKSDSDRKHPGTALPLYDATDLKKRSPHEIEFRIHGQQHSLKAANDAERDGWYMSLEKAVEMGKAQKESVRSSEGYKSEMEKLNKPNVGGVAGAAVAGRSQSTPKKSTDVNGTAADAPKKDQKSRSTSRGMLDRFNRKKDEMENKVQDKKEEKKAEKEEPQHDKEAEKAVEAAAPAAVAGGAALDARGTADHAVGAPVENEQKPVEESGPVHSTGTKKEEKVDDKPKSAKRASIFGKMQAGLGNIRSPGKEKDQKEAELKSEVPAKDNEIGTSETAPQIPEPSGTEPAKDAADPPADLTKPEVQLKPAEDTKEKLDETSPSGNQKGFLSGLPFVGKGRGRSVSPTANLKEQPAKKEEPPAVPAKDDAPIEATPAKAEEPAVDTTTALPDEAEKPVEKPAEKPVEKSAEELKKDETKSKRESIFGSIGRRASKALNRMQAPTNKENAPSATTNTEAKKEDVAAEAKKDEEKPTVNGGTKAPETEQQPSSIGDVVPDAVHTGQPENSTPAVTASA